MPNSLRAQALKIAGVYFAVAAVYIVGSGMFVSAYEPQGRAYLIYETFKGLGFVLLTALLLYQLVRRYVNAVHEEAVHAHATEQELRRRTDQLTTAQRIAHLGSWEANLRNGELSWSEEVYAIFGIDPASFDHRMASLDAFVHRDDRDALVAARDHTIAGAGPLDMEHRIIRPDGEERYVHERAEVVTDEAGRPLRLVGTVQDVTQRKHVALTLERHDRQQAAIAELGMQALREIDVPRLMERAMAAAAQTLDVEYTKVLERLPSGRLRLVAGIGWQPALVGQAEVSGGSDSQAGHTLAVNGPVVVTDLRTETRFSGPPLLAEHGVVSGISTVIHGTEAPWGVLGIHTTRRRRFSEADVAFVQTLANLIGDVLERERAQELLGEHDFLRRVAGQAASLGGWAYDLRSNIMTWSPEVAELHDMPPGYSPTVDEGIGFYAPECQARIRRRFEACCRDGAGYDEELAIVTARGRQLAVRAVGQAQRDEQGRIIGVHGAFQDISERKRLESMLQQSQRLEAVGQLTGGVAHDFNNLLTVILGNADLMQEHAGNDPALAQLIDTTRQAAQRGAELTRALLAYARKQPLEPRATNVADLLSNVDPLLRRSIGERIELENIRGGGLWRAMVDPAQLESALLNLCLNARDAMPEGGKLTVETANVHLDDAYAREHHEVIAGQYVMIAVSDTGHGIPPEMLDRVFEPFFTTKQASQGTGLGLSMVYGFAKQSRGHVKLYSEPGRGTTVKLYVPRTWSDVGQPEPSRGPDDSLGHGERVLVVEDDPMVRRFVTEQVERLGYRVRPAASAAEALALLEEEGEVDLLFTDVVMPGAMDGRDLADAVRERYPQLPILFTSGYTENAIVHQGRLDPGVMLLTKPYRRSELADKLRTVLRRGNRG